MRRAALPLALAALLAGALPARASSPPTGRLLVSLAPAGRSAVAADAQALAARAGALPAAAPVPQIGLVVLRPQPGESLAALARRLRRDPRVRAVSVEHRYTLRDVPDDPALTEPETASGSPPALTREWWPAAEDFPDAWSITHGAGALVAVIDTGVDGSHPDLATKLVRAVDLDGDGPATVDTVGHGTHVASLACAATGNGIGIAGAGWDCGLIVEKSDLSDSSVARDIVDATDHGAMAINMSFGTDGRTQAPPAIADALRYAYAHRVVLVAAASDQHVTEQGDPANFLQPTGTGPQLATGEGLSVTAAAYGDVPTAYAGYGTQISLAAAGAVESSGGPPGLLGAYPANTTQLDTGLAGQPPCGCRTSEEGDARYAYLQGTSMAAPQVAAVGALIRRLNPDLPIARLLQIVKQTATRPSGAWTPGLGWGVLDAGAALAAARQVDATPPLSSVRAPARPRGHVITLRISGRDPSPPGVASSGIARYEVYRSIDGHRAVRIAVTTGRTLRVHVRPGRRYAFYTRAVDRAGNVESPPSRRAAAPRVARVRVR